MSDSTQPVKLRFPPSPTGPVTLGNIRTFLFNWLFARHHGGSVVLRFEDTDPARSMQKYESVIARSLEWLGLTWDEGPKIADENGIVLYEQKGINGPYRQTERGAMYRKYLEQLLAEGKAYYCYCTKDELEAQKQIMEAEGRPPKYNGHCREITTPPDGKNPETIRFKIPPVEVGFKDTVRGLVKFDASLFGDVIIARNIDSPLYNFAVVVDDALMGITHVLRGEEHISNTPKQILLGQALGFDQPIFGHLPLMLGPDKKKLSKRTAEVSMLDYQNKGYLAEAMANFLALLGWHPPGDAEIFSVPELIEAFSVARIQKAGAIFNPEKLEWLNMQHMRTLPEDEFKRRALPFLEKEGIVLDDAVFSKLVAAQRERAKTFADFATQAKELFFIPDYDATLLVWKKDAPVRTKEILRAILDALLLVSPADFDGTEVARALSELMEKESRGSVLWPFRVALSGRAASPDPMEIIDAIGKEETIARVKNALNKLSLL